MSPLISGSGSVARISSSSRASAISRSSPSSSSIRLRSEEASRVSCWAARLSSQREGAFSPGWRASSRARRPGRSKVLLELLDPPKELGGPVQQLRVRYLLCHSQRLPDGRPSGRQTYEARSAAEAKEAVEHRSERTSGT